MALPTQKTNREKRKFLSVFLLQKRRKKRTKCTKQLPLKQTLFFLFLDFLRGIATAVFIRKHNKNLNKK